MRWSKLLTKTKLYYQKCNKWTKKFDPQSLNPFFEKGVKVIKDPKVKGLIQIKDDT